MNRTCRLPRGRVVLDDLGAEDVGRHEVRRELNAAELEVHRVGERLDEQRLREAGHAAQQTVAAGEETGQNLAAHLLLADDDATDLVVEARDQRRGFVKGEQGRRWMRRWRAESSCLHIVVRCRRRGPV